MSQKTAGEIGEDKKQEIGANIKTFHCVKSKKGVSVFMSSLVQDIQHKGQDLRKFGMTMMLLTNRESPVEHLVL